MATDETASDEDLMTAYRGGDAGAFDELYKRHKAPLFRYLVRQCHDRAAAEELFQDIWMNLIRARANYTVAARFKTYLYCLAHNRLIDHYRRHAAASFISFDNDEGSVPDIAAEKAAEPESACSAKEQAMRLLHVLESLPAAQREAFVLQFEAGMSVEEIAAVAGVNRETAKSRLRYAMSKVRAGMRGWL